MMFQGWNPKCFDEDIDLQYTYYTWCRFKFSDVVTRQKNHKARIMRFIHTEKAFQYN